MVGRYGTDQLTLFMLIAGMVLTFIGNALRLEFLTIITYAIFIVCVYRTLSRNIPARQKENIMFLKYFNPAKSWSKSKYNIVKDSKDYQYFKCPHCQQVMRVPRGRGKISVTCRKCGTKFIKKS
jgi:predicted RNA-binding Zn-ribbon protein involved in translation (DUF1610 family)